MNQQFSWRRLWAVITKEFIQMRRDRMTFAMMVGIPLIQLILFGFAINSNPRHLPTAVLTAEHSPYTRTLIQGFKNTDYFRFVKAPKSEKQADDWMRQGKVLFIINIPPAFTTDLLRGHKPKVLLTADATDPVATVNAIGAARVLAQQVFDSQLEGVVKNLKPSAQPFELVAHARYNPESITQYSIVPGLIGVVLTMTLVIITSLAITKEYERGTIENLLVMPFHPLEVMLGKVIPYILVGYLQIFLILLAAAFIFFVPIRGSLTLLLLLTLPFIFANLSVGLTFSTLAKNQLQAVQMTFFFFLPSLLLSGFMFPFYGMPVWAQWLGNLLPLTHFLRIVRGILLKGNDVAFAIPDLWPIILFMVVVIFIGWRLYHRTLD